jgi:hypothetical protein
LLRLTAASVRNTLAKYPDDEAPRSAASAAVFAARKGLLF